MPTLRIHLEHEELSAVRRRAAELGVTVEALAYGALNCSMSHVGEAFCRGRIHEAAKGTGKDLPLWSDSARSVGAYGAQGDIHSGPGPKGGPL